MAIQMIGIDHSVAAIDIRTVFSFTQKKTVEALEIIKQEKGICGCVLLSTCNRMELWVSTEEGCVIALYELLCKIRAIHNDEYQKYFTERKEEDAVQHLFRLACGLKSRILGEDQILTQVKGALVTAREHYAADNVLEVLFRMAVTAGKKVRTNVTFSAGNHSVIHRALQTLRQEGLEVKGKKCMVIGNGEMGKLAATVLQQEGADVTVTVRQYRSGVVQIPQGCRRIDYGKRMGLISSCDFVVSATASPNYTLTKEGLQAVDLDHELILVDLAVPRDIDPEVQKLMYIRFYDIDYFKVDVLSEKMKAGIREAESILKEQMEEFCNWYRCLDVIPRIGKIKEEVATDLDLRLYKILHQLPMEVFEKETLEKQIHRAAQKVTNKMLFELRGRISDAAFRESTMVVEMLEELLNAGFPVKTAVQIMNTALVTGREEVMFSTIDVAIIDLYDASCEIVKAGAATTYIKRKDEVEEVHSISLPIGALARLDIEPERRQLEDGDFLIMVTDGVLDTLPTEKQDSLMEEFICQVESQNPGEMAHHILNRVMEYAGAAPLDDMTILVTGIWKL